MDLRGTVDPVYRGPAPFSRDLGDGVRENFWGWRQRAVQTQTGIEDCFVDFVLSTATSIEEFERHRWPSPDWFDFSDFAARLETWREFAVMATGPSIFQHVTFLRGMEPLLCDMAAEPELAHWLMDRFTNYYLAYFDRMFTAAPGLVDIMRVADDLGTQQSLLLGSEMFGTFLQPRLRKLVDMAHSHGVKVMFHSCGAIGPLIEGIIETGVDILDPLQAAAEGMDPVELKADYGARICLHGGICTQHLLPHGSVEEVQCEVLRRLEILSPGGGYILAPCHILQTDVPTANILAMSETGFRFAHEHHTRCFRTRLGMKRRRGSTMNARERFVNTCRHQPTDRGVLWQERFWPETLERWRTEGMPDDFDFGWDYHDDRDSMRALGINLGFLPAWETGLVTDEGPTQLVRDEYGVIKRVWKAKSGMPQFVSFPVSNRADWEAVRERLSADAPGRFPADWAERVQRANAAEYPVSFGGSHLCGFFSFLRELFGDDVYYVFADDPDLLHDMLTFQSERLSDLLRRAAGEVRIDRLFIWEDMAFKTGPLIGPELWREFLMEPYQNYIAVAGECGIPVVDVDSDGNIEKLIPLWLEAGVTMLHPFEVAAGMDIVKTKHEYGDRLAVRGGVDKRALAAGPDAIDRELERIRPAVEAGGCIPAVDHSVPPDVSWDDFQYYLRRRAELQATCC